MDAGRLMKITSRLISNGVEFEPIEDEQSTVQLKKRFSYTQLMDGSYLKTVKDLKDMGLAVRVEESAVGSKVYNIKVF